MNRTLEKNIAEYTLTDRTVSILENTFLRCTTDESLVFKQNVLDKSCTRQGIQTTNIIRHIDPSCIDEIYKYAHLYITDYYEKRLYYYYLNIDYAHMIHYLKGGHQLIHTHSKIEDHSFIVYLNDSSGCTRIYCGDSHIDIPSKRGKLVVFDAALYHEGTVCEEERKLIVGSIRFLYKVWAHRPEVPIDASLAQG